MDGKRLTAAALCLLLTGCATESGPDASSSAEIGSAASETRAVQQTETTAHPTETTAQPAEEPVYIWYRAPFLEAENVNPVNEEALDFNYGYFMENGCFVYVQDGKLGLLDEQGNILMQPAYSSVNGERNSSSGHLCFETESHNWEDKQYFCPKTGSMTRIPEMQCPLCGEWLSTSIEGVGYLYDAARKVTGTFTSQAVHVHDEDLRLSMLGQFMFEPVTTAESVMARGISLPDDYLQPAMDSFAQLENGFGIVRQDETVADFVYEEATDFKDGLAAFCMDGKWGYLNPEGETVIPFAYDADFVYNYGYTYSIEDSTWTIPDRCYPYLPSEGLIALNQGDAAGYAALDGSEVVPVGTFAAARPVTDGFAWVLDKESGLWGIISFDTERSAANESAVRIQQ